MFRNIWDIAGSIAYIYLCCSSINCPLLLNVLGSSYLSKSDVFGINTSALDILFCSKQPSSPACIDIDNSTCGSSMLEIKGYPMHIIYNRVPKSASTTLRNLFREQASKRKFTIFNKKIYVPFLLSFNAQQEVIYEINNAKTPVLYERHMYFVRFDTFQKPQPVYINIVRDPLELTVSSYYFSRQTCIEERRCYFDVAFLNETLDDCLERRSSNQCVSQSQGVSPMIPFFCGNEIKCKKNKTFALNKAKENIVNYYTVVGIVEELYNFLFVLEHLMPRYFANIRLAYMSNGMRRIDNKRSNIVKNKDPSEVNKRALRVALVNEYELYNFIKRRFHLQFKQVLKTFTN
ncbi:unnamed protein product [Rotaria sp. Silwood1]|nr:unnamed protein product [Rotaria sp. Silwood1]